MSAAYAPPFTITPRVLDLVALISEALGRWEAQNPEAMTPKLRRSRRLRTIHSSLAIENNSLSLDQVTAVVEGKKVLGPAKDILEVRNAFAAYEKLDDWNPSSTKHFLAAHGILMQGLVDRPGHFRSGGVGIMQGAKLVHLAPSAAGVPGLVKDLLGWLKQKPHHPLITSCVVHYELEFIHPFADGNGRIGRLWQTLILSRWKPELAFLPVESVIREQQAGYYRALAAADKAGQSTVFIEFMLSTLLQSLEEVTTTDQVSDQVTDQVKALFKCLANGPLSALDCMKKLGLSHRPTFRKNYLQPALEARLIERTLPDKPNSSQQKYRLTAKG
ncbi:Fic family protein [Prosthecobacter sp.]|uniref:Fic family protein n=1 Tax=Prosthecobacter sp. TaxID=1965333 RepID=UPI0037840549